MQTIRKFYQSFYQIRTCVVPSKLPILSLPQRNFCLMNEETPHYSKEFEQYIQPNRMNDLLEKFKNGSINDTTVRTLFKELHRAANINDGKAQFTLGLLYLSDLEENGLDNVEDNNEHLRDIKSIRKEARKAYLRYKKEKKVLKDFSERKQNGIVTHATVEDMDETFGVYYMTLLDPHSRVSSNSVEFIDPQVNDSKGMYWLRRAAENGHAEACVRLGNYCLRSDPTLPSESVFWYKKVAERSHPDALYNLGSIYYEGITFDNKFVIPKDVPLAIDYFEKAAEKNDTSAKFFLGHLYRIGCEEGCLIPNQQRSLKLLKEAAEEDHDGCQFYLAQLFRSGNNEYQDIVKGKTFNEPTDENVIRKNTELFWRYLQLAINNENTDAYYCLADIYFNGSDGKQVDFTKAHEYYKLASQGGEHPEALCCLGTMYYKGIGVNQDFKTAFNYYQNAADLNSLEAWKNLAAMYLLGHGVPRNEKTAHSILSMINKVTSKNKSDGTYS